MHNTGQRHKDIKIYLTSIIFYAVLRYFEQT